MDRVIQKKFFARHRVAVGICVILTILVAAAVATRWRASVNSVRMDKNMISVGVAKRGVMADYMLLRASAVARDTVYIDADEGGNVQKILIRPGDAVKKDQPLVILTNTQLELQVLEQEGRLIDSMTQLQNAQTSLEQNRLNNEVALNEIEYNVTRLKRVSERAEALVEKGMISRASMDGIQDELHSYMNKRSLQIATNEKLSVHRQKQLPQLAAQIETLREDLKITRSKLEKLTVRAPDDGLVTVIDLKVGQTLRQGDRLAQITLNTGFKLTQAVDEFYLPRMHVGQTGEVQVQGKPWPIKVERIYPQIKNGTFVVDFGFIEKAPTELLPGQTIQGKISFDDYKGGKAATVIYLPVGTYLERSGGSWVFVLTDDGRSAVRRNIKVGRRNPEQIEVLEGLSAGERFISSDYTGLDTITRVDIR